MLFYSNRVTCKVTLQRQIDVQCALKMLLIASTTAQMEKEKNADKQNIQAPWL